MHKPTIVAPGGSYEKAMVAASYGADEVYIGVPFTSLRMRQNKVRDFEMLKKSIEKIHSYGSKALLTMNIFPRNMDIKIFESVVEKIKDVGADAIIFSDLGTYNIIKKHIPDMPLHLSTQTTTLNYAAVQFWADLGVKRIVCARELHVSEIQEIKKHVPNMELEVFVHGAMCMTYSGRCLLGEYCSGRDGNKGECSHVCRYKYKVRLEEEKRPGKFFQLEGDEDGSYIMSSKDLCTIQRLKEIMPYVDALKIEGRSKSELYAGATVKAYKEARDAILEGREPDAHIVDLVNQVPHRPYRDGFLLKKMREEIPDGETDTPVDFAKKDNCCGAKDGETCAKGDDCCKSEKETTSHESMSLDSAGPLFARNYWGLITEETKEKDGKIYHAFVPKEVIEPGDELRFLSRENYGELKILDIINGDGNALDKAHCNIKKVYIHTDHELQGREVLYKEIKDV